MFNQHTPSAVKASTRRMEVKPSRSLPACAVASARACQTREAARTKVKQDDRELLSSLGSTQDRHPGWCALGKVGVELDELGGDVCAEARLYVQVLQAASIEYECSP